MCYSVINLPVYIQLQPSVGLVVGQVLLILRRPVLLPLFFLSLCLSCQKTTAKGQKEKELYPLIRRRLTSCAPSQILWPLNISVAPSITLSLTDVTGGCSTTPKPVPAPSQPHTGIDRLSLSLALSNWWSMLVSSHSRALEKYEFNLIF